MYIMLTHHDPSEKLRLVHHLLELGCKISVISSADWLVNVAEETPPDLLLVGFRTLDAYALRIVNTLRHHPTTTGIPLALISPADRDDQHLQAFAAGCNAILKTPFSIADVDALLKHFRSTAAV